MVVFLRTIRVSRMHSGNLYQFGSLTFTAEKMNTGRMITLLVMNTGRVIAPLMSSLITSKSKHVVVQNLQVRPSYTKHS